MGRLKLDSEFPSIPRTSTWHFMRKKLIFDTSEFETPITELFSDRLSHKVFCCRHRPFSGLRIFSEKQPRHRRRRRLDLYLTDRYSAKYSGVISRFNLHIFRQWPFVKTVEHVGIHCCSNLCIISVGKGEANPVVCEWTPPRWLGHSGWNFQGLSRAYARMSGWKNCLKKC